MGEEEAGVGVEEAVGGAMEGESSRVVSAERRPLKRLSVVSSLVVTIQHLFYHWHTLDLEVRWLKSSTTSHCTLCVSDFRSL